MGILSNQKDSQEKDAQTAAEPKAVLNEQQEIAANHEYGSAFISACPGSGKTRVVVERTARLIDKGHSPRNILCITFTNKAAAEMKERLRARLGDAVGDLYVSTFHSLSANILRRFGRSIGYVDGMTIMDSSDQEDVMSQTARQLGFDYKRGEIFGLCWIANTARERLLPIERFGEVHDDENKVRVAQEYVERIKKNNQVDFSGLLSETIRLLKKDTEVLQRLQDRFKFIQVDEAQDTNLAQFEMVNLLSVHKNVVMVGDIDQCQPAGTMVMTVDGEVDIADLKPKKHKLVSFSRRQSIVIGRNNGFGFNKSSRAYSGNMFSIACDVYQTWCTPNHKWTVKFDTKKLEKYHCVYLMTNDEGQWRVGRTSMWKSTGKKQNGTMGVTLRARQEKASKLWILRLFEDACEAQAWEQYVSIFYGIPTLCFRSGSYKSPCWDAYENIVFKSNAITVESISQCLVDHDRNIKYPFWQKRNREDRNYGRRIPLTVEACNLLPEVMNIPVPSSGKEFDWTDFRIGIERDWKGRVYSLDVEKYEHYIADGLITHNSIYGWRGARYDNINDFVKQNKAKVIEFPWNYRSTPEIVERAEQLIRWNEGRDKVQFKTVNASGAPIEYYEHDNSREEGSWVADKVYEMMVEHGYGPEDCAVLYRVNAHSQHIELGFRSLGMPVNMVGGQSFFDRAEIKDCFAMLKFYVNPRDGMALSRFINKPARSIGNVTLGKIENYAQEKNVDMLEALRLAPEYLTSVPKKEAVLASLKLIYETFSADYSEYNIGQMLYEFVTKLNYLDFLREKYADDFLERENYINELSKDAAVAGDASRKNTEGYLARQALTSSSDKETQQGRVTLMTMHAAKGLEFPVVIIPSMEDDILPHFRSKAEKSVDEERRLCYVAMTRAKERLVLSRCRNRQVRSGRNFMNKRTKPSQFLTEMGVLEEKA